jgi:hypothetical protein
MRKTITLLLLMLLETSAVAGNDSTSVGRPPVDTSSLKSAAGTGLSSVVAPLEGKTIVCKTVSSGRFSSGKPLYWGAAKVQGGKIYTLAYTGTYSLQLGTRSTGWKLGKEASYSVMSGGNGNPGYSIQSIVDATGITVWQKTQTFDFNNTLATSDSSVGCTMPWPNN